MFTIAGMAIASGARHGFGRERPIRRGNMRTTGASTKLKLDNNKKKTYIVDRVANGQRLIVWNFC